MYAYKVYNHFKIYRPLADKYTKWRSNLNINDVQGFKQLPKTGDTLIMPKDIPHAVFGEERFKMQLVVSF